MCGVVLDDAAFSADVTFTKGPGGESAVDGQRVSEAGVARGMGRIAGGRVYGHQVGTMFLLIFRSFWSAVLMHCRPPTGTHKSQPHV